MFTTVLDVARGSQTQFTNFRLNCKNQLKTVTFCIRIYLKTLANDPSRVAPLETISYGAHRHHHKINGQTLPLFFIVDFSFNGRLKYDSKSPFFSIKINFII